MMIQDYNFMVAGSYSNSNLISFQAGDKIMSTPTTRGLGNKTQQFGQMTAGVTSLSSFIVSGWNHERKRNNITEWTSEK
jgi:hypothetical protein